MEWKGVRMKQWLNAGVALIGGLMLAVVLVIGLQNPVPPADPPASATPIALPPPTPTVLTDPTAPPLADIPADRSGMVLGLATSGGIRLLSADGTRAWLLQPQQRFIGATWAPNGRYIAAVTSDRQPVIVQPDQRDAMPLLAPGDNLDGSIMTWTGSLTVAMSLEQRAHPSTLAVWSYRNRDFAMLGEGRAPAAAAREALLAWAAADGRSVLIKRGDAAPDVLLDEQALGHTADQADRSRNSGIFGQPGSPAMQWSPDGGSLTVATPPLPEDGRRGWSVTIVTADGSVKQSWMLDRTERLYQLGWINSRELLFTDDNGFGAIDRQTGTVKRLLKQAADARYFAVSASGDQLIVSTASGLRRVPVSALAQPDAALEPFGPMIAAYQQLDMCCQSDAQSVAVQ